MRILVVALLVLAGCAGGRGIGHVEPQFVRHTQQRQGVWRSKVHVDGQGNVTKLALYHRDAAAIPEAIRDLAQQRFPGGKIESYETELHADAGWVHEVEVTTAEGRNCELSAAEPAQLRYVECRLATEELKPELLQKASELVPGGELQEAESHEGEGHRDVRVEMRREGLTHYLRFDLQGNLLEHELRVPATLAVPVP